MVTVCLGTRPYATIDLCMLASWQSNAVFCLFWWLGGLRRWELEEGKLSDCATLATLAVGQVDVVKRSAKNTDDVYSRLGKKFGTLETVCNCPSAYARSSLKPDERVRSTRSEVYAKSSGVCERMGAQSTYFQMKRAA